jgi:hypothetical protein
MALLPGEPSETTEKVVTLNNEHEFSSIYNKYKKAVIYI